MFVLTSDESVIGNGGKVLYFSIDKFIKDICEGDFCFICGVSPSEADFNNEHVLPKWILREYGLYTKSITLPNGTSFRYDHYTVPCCKQCNSLIGRMIEEPVRNLVTQGYEAVSHHLNQKGPWLFFVWLTLLSLKTYLKDKSLRFHRDHRLGDERIFDFYTWEGLHHIHCVARSFFTNCEIDPKVMGSFVVLPAKVESHFENFDYSALYAPQTVLLRMGDFCFIAVLNDSCQSLVVLRSMLEKISGPLSPIQLREIMARLAYINLKLRERPIFYPEFDLKEGLYRMSVHTSSMVALDNYQQSEFGIILYSCCKNVISNLPNSDSYKKRLEDQAKKGYTFLFDAQEHFIADSMDLLPLGAERS